MPKEERQEPDVVMSDIKDELSAIREELHTMISIAESLRALVQEVNRLHLTIAYTDFYQGHPPPHQGVAVETPPKSRKATTVEIDTPTTKL